MPDIQILNIYKTHRLIINDRITRGYGHHVVHAQRKVSADIL